MRPRRGSVSTLASVATFSTVSTVSSTANSIFSTRASTHTTPSPVDAQEDEFPVLAAFDFDSSDPSHLPFKRGEIIEIIKTEDSGWWAGVLGDRVGWVPKSFVQLISDDMAEVLRHVPLELRQEELEKELLAEANTIANAGTGASKSEVDVVGVDVETQEWGQAMSRLTSVRLGTDENVNEPIYHIPTLSGINALPSLTLTIPQIPQSTTLTLALSPSLALSPQLPPSTEIDTSDSPSSSTQPSTSSDFAPSPITPHTHFLLPSDTTNTTPYRQRKPPTGSGSSNSTPNLNASLSPISPASPAPASSSLSSAASTATPTPTPIFKSKSPVSLFRHSSHPHGRNQRSESVPAALPNPIISVWDRHSLSTLAESVSSDKALSTSPTATTSPTQISPTSPSFPKPNLPSRSLSLSAAAAFTSRGRSHKVRQLTGDEDAFNYLSAKAESDAAPWFLKPLHSSETRTILFEDGVFEGVGGGGVKGGTVEALVERLCVESIRPTHEHLFLTAFLSAYPTFSTGDEIFYLLAERYQMEQPSLLTEEEIEIWKERKLKVTQLRVLNVIKAWIEQHYLMLEEPLIANKLTEFLRVIKSPPINAELAGKLLQTLQQQKLNPLSIIPQPTSTPPLKKRKAKPHKNDILRVEASELAQHLTLLCARLYAKILASECLRYSRTQGGTGTGTLVIGMGMGMVMGGGAGERTGECVNLKAMEEMSESLTSWVKWSVLSVESLGKRANLIDHWIRVAEKCRQFNNLSSMHAIVIALNSPLITRLHLTWAHVGRQSHLEPLTKLIDPSANYSNYRVLAQSLEGPCIPYVGIYLTDLTQINDVQPDVLPDALPPLINFYKRQLLHTAMDSLLRFQSKPFIGLLEISTTLELIQSSLVKVKDIDPGLFAVKSQELMVMEVEHADIRKGLEAAGF